MKKVHAFKEDMAPQMILLMGLPAAGKSTFVKTNLIKFYNHRMPHLTSMQVLNSDVQLRRMQYERAREDFDRLQGLEKDAYEAVTKDMRYKSNEGKEISFTLPYEQFVGMPFNDFFKRMYKEYYATFFGDRGKAKKSTDELALKKIKGGDVVILDSVGTTTDKMLKYFEMGKKQGYTTSVVFLEIDPDISIARDLYRGQTEGRSVGEGVIRTYEPKLKPAWQTYFKSPMVDRLLHFRWIPASPTDVVKGKYKLVRDLKRYGAGRATKPAAEPQAASVKTSAAKPVSRQIKRDIIASLLRGGRRDLANVVANSVEAAYLQTAAMKRLQSLPEIAHSDPDFQEFFEGLLKLKAYVGFDDTKSRGLVSLDAWGDLGFEVGDENIYVDLGRPAENFMFKSPKAALEVIAKMLAIVSLAKRTGV